MADTNFPFPLTLGEPQTQTSGGSVFGSFAQDAFLGVRAIFLIFHNGQHQFCISVNTQRTSYPNFGGSVIESFALGHIFGELESFF